MVSMSRADLAFWSVVRHVNKKAAHYAPDDTVHRAYEVVTDHAEERFEYFVAQRMSRVRQRHPNQSQLEDNGKPDTT
jgi:hypothetical protein